METKEKLKAKIAIPLDSFSTLIQENCGEELNENNCIDLVIRNMFSLYSHFSNTTSLGFIYASKGLFKDEPMDMLDSPVSLRPFRKHLSKSSNAMKFIYSMDYDYYTVLQSTVFHGYEIMNFQEKGVSDSAILNIMSKNALALDYWVLFHVND